MCAKLPHKNVEHPVTQTMPCIVLVCIESGALLKKDANAREHIELTAAKACNVRALLAGSIFVHAEKMSL